MLEVNVEQFWRDDGRSHEDNCFCAEAPQAALGIAMSEECVYAELNEPGEPWLPVPRQRRLELNRRYNDRAERIVGRRLLPDDLPTDDMQLPPVAGIHELFGGRYVQHGGSLWLEPCCDSPEGLRAVLDRVDERRRDIRAFLLPRDWQQHKRRVYETYGILPSRVRWVRGPVTLAMSLFGIENLIFLIADDPDLARRFSDAIAGLLCDIADVMDAEVGCTGEQEQQAPTSPSGISGSPGDTSRPGGFWFNDDNCCLLTPAMYEFFAYPILKRVFERYSPNPGDTRYQHSDSAMGHLLPILARLNLTGCNFGPTLTVEQIRAHMPRTRIDGQLAPFTFMSNDENAIIAEVRRDCEMAKDARGLNVTTAGSINNGSKLTSMRAVMFAIQNYGRY